MLAGFLINTTGYPSSVIVECIEPKNYPALDSWYYGQWNDGRWTNVDKLGECFDPTLCHDDPPTLPLDNSLTTELVMDDLDRKLGSKINYKCRWKCAVESKSKMSPVLPDLSCRLDPRR